MNTVQKRIAGRLVTAIVASEGKASVAYALALEAHEAELRQKDIVPLLVARMDVSTEYAKGLASHYWPVSVQGQKHGTRAPRKSAAELGASEYKRLSGRMNGRTKLVIVAMCKEAGITASDLK